MAITMVVFRGPILLSNRSLPCSSTKGNWGQGEERERERGSRCLQGVERTCDALARLDAPTRVFGLSCNDSSCIGKSKYMGHSCMARGTHSQ